MTTFAEPLAKHLPPSTADRPTAVYRFYNADGQLLYVGITCNLPGRLQAHQRDSSWWADHRSVNVVWLDTRPEAVVAERAAIRSEKPIHNVAGTRLPRVRMRDLRPDLATREAIGMEVRVEIARSGRRKAEIREVLGLSRQSMWQCVKGEIAFSEDELAALADHLGISVDRFVPKMAAAA